jgi:hypothetical protein
LGDIVNAISGESTLNHYETVTLKRFGEFGPREVFTRAVHDAVAHGQNLRKDR